MYRGEAFVLQIDAHTHAAREWDEILLGQWKRAANEMAVISVYPSDSTGVLTKDFRVKPDANQRAIMCQSAFTRGGVAEPFGQFVVHSAQPEGPPPRALKNVPMLEVGWGAGLSFSRGHWVARVPYDPYLPMVFQGEEMSMGVRAWTHGYDFYGPAVPQVILHEYACFSVRRGLREKQVAHFDVANSKPKLNADASVRSFRRLNALIGAAGRTAGGEYDTREATKYGVGAVRPASLFYSTFGIDLQERKMPNWCYFVQSGGMHRALQPLVQPGSGIDYRRAPKLDFSTPGGGAVVDYPRGTAKGLVDDYPGQRVVNASKRMDPFLIRSMFGNLSHAEAPLSSLPRAACAVMRKTSQCLTSEGRCNSEPGLCCTTPEWWEHGAPPSAKGVGANNTVQLASPDDAQVMASVWDSMDTQLLDMIRLAPPAAHVDGDAPPPKLMCVSWTYHRYHELHGAAAMARTWMARCDGAVVLSDVDDELIPSVKVPHLGPEDDASIWMKTRANWQYLLKHYGDEYEWFVFGGSDFYVIVENLVEYVRSESISSMHASGKPIYMGRLFKYPNLDNDDTFSSGLLFNSGGPGYLLNVAALRKFVTAMDTPACYPRKLIRAEDVMVAECLRSTGIVGIDTRDDDGRERFLPFTPGNHLGLRPREAPGWYKDYSFDLQYGEACCSPGSIGFHFVLTPDLYRMHAVMYRCERPPLVARPRLRSP